MEPERDSRASLKEEGPTRIRSMHATHTSFLNVTIIIREMRTLQLRRARHTASGRQEAEWGADLGSPVGMANPDPLTPPCSPLLGTPIPEKSSETHALGKAWTPLTSPPRAHSSCCPRWMGPRAPSEPSSEAGRMRQEGILRNRKNSNTDRRVSEACPWVRSPAKAPTSGQHQASVCLGGCLGQKLEGRPPGPAHLQDAAPKNSTICIKGRAAHTLALCPRGHPPTMLLPHGGSFQWGCPGRGKGSRYSLNE